MKRLFSGHYAWAVSALVLGCVALLVVIIPALPSLASDPPDSKWDSFILVAGEDGSEFKAGTKDGVDLSSAQPGEIFTGKSVEHQLFAGDPNGLVTVKLEAWALSYRNDLNVLTNPLDILYTDAIHGPVYLEIVDDLGDFRITPSGMPPPSVNYVVEAGPGNTLVWKILNPQVLYGSAPYTLSYELEVDIDDSSTIALDWNFKTGEARARFKTAQTNPIYWQRVTTEAAVLTVEVIHISTNASPAAFNGALIDDYEKFYRLDFGKNEGRSTTVPAFILNSGNNLVINPQAIWNRGADRVRVTHMMTGEMRLLEWHAQRVGSVIVLTVLDQYGPSMHGQYSLDTGSSQGSNVTLRIDRHVVSEGWRHIEQGKAGTVTYSWETELGVVTEVLSSTIPVIGQMGIFRDLSTINFDLEVIKDYGTSGFHRYWGQDRYTLQELRIRVYDGSGVTKYLDFARVEDPTGAYRIYNYSGMSTSGTIVRFSEATPTLLRGIRSYDDHDEALHFEAYELDNWDPSLLRKPTVTTTYLLDIAGSTVTDDCLFDAGEPGDWLEEISLLVTNNYSRPDFGELSLAKSLSGFPYDWGYNLHSEFEVRVWDAIGENPDSAVVGNYLMFRPRPEDPDRPDKSIPYGYAEGTLYCTGNTGTNEYKTLDAYLAFYDDYMTNGGSLDDWIDGAASPDPWNWSDKIWQRKVLEREDIVLTSLEISADQLADPPTLSFLWPGPYEVHEFQPGGSFEDLVSETTSPTVEPWTYHNLYVSELDGEYRVVEESDVPAGGKLHVITINHFEPVETNVSLEKRVVGQAQHWGVTAETEFPVTIWDDSAGGYMLFTATPNPLDARKTWWQFVGVEVAGVRTDTTDWGGDIDDETLVLKQLSIKPNQITLLSNMFGDPDSRYIVRELDDDLGGHVHLFLDAENIVTDDGEVVRGYMIESAAERELVITNAYLTPDDNKLVFHKQYAGDIASHELDCHEVFLMSLRHIETGRQLVLDPQPDITVGTDSYADYLTVGEYDHTSGLVYAWDDSAGDYVELGPLSQYPGWTLSAAFSVAKPAQIGPLDPTDYLLSESAADADLQQWFEPSLAGIYHSEADDVLNADIVNSFETYVEFEGGDGNGNGNGGQIGEEEEDTPLYPNPTVPPPKPPGTPVPRPTPAPAAPAPQPPQGGVRLPRAGDAATLGLWLVMMMGASAALHYYSRRARKKE